MTMLPLVTVLVTCRNEARHIGDCLWSVLENGYPRDRLEVFVIDGMSDDGSRDVVRKFAADHPNLWLLDNPERTTPHALNIGIKAARGEAIIWVSAHCDYPQGYLSACVQWLLNMGVDRTGGVQITEPSKPTLFGRAVAAMLSTPTGVGNSAYRMGGGEPREVDTVHGGCYRRDVFSRIGLFNEHLARGQDYEFGQRMARAGMTTLLLPEVRFRYKARADVWPFLRHTFANGMWVILPFRHSTVVPVAPRHLAPLAFVLALVASTAAVILTGAPWLPMVVLGPYALVVLRAAWRSAQGDWKLLAVLPALLAAFHITYGLGSLVALGSSLPSVVARYADAMTARFRDSARPSLQAPSPGTVFRSR